MILFTGKNGVKDRPYRLMHQEQRATHLIQNRPLHSKFFTGLFSYRFVNIRLDRIILFSQYNAERELRSSAELVRV